MTGWEILPLGHPKRQERISPRILRDLVELGCRIDATKCSMTLFIETRPLAIGNVEYGLDWDASFHVNSGNSVNGSKFGPMSASNAQQLRHGVRSVESCPVHDRKRLFKGNWVVAGESLVRMCELILLMETVKCWEADLSDGEGWKEECLTLNTAEEAEWASRLNVPANCVHLSL